MAAGDLENIRPTNPDGPYAAILTRNINIVAADGSVHSVSSVWYSDKSSNTHLIWKRDHSDDDTPTPVTEPLETYVTGSGNGLMAIYKPSADTVLSNYTVLSLHNDISTIKNTEALMIVENSGSHFADIGSNYSATNLKSYVLRSNMELSVVGRAEYEVDGAPTPVYTINVTLTEPVTLNSNYEYLMPLGVAAMWGSNTALIRSGDGATVEMANWGFQNINTTGTTIQPWAIVKYNPGTNGLIKINP